MLRPHREYPQFRPGLVPSGTAPSMNGAAGGGMNAPVNIPMNMAPSSYTPPPPGTGSFMRPPISGGNFAYPPPPPTPVPAPHLGHFLPPLQAAPFVPPLPPTPPVEAPPPPPPPPPPIASPLDDLSPPHSNPVERSPTKQASLLLPSEPSKPRDAELLKNIEDMAEFVVKNGPRYESMARAKHDGDPKFGFLFENDSCPEAVTHHDYYKWKKDILQLQSEAAMKVKSGKRLESVIVSSPSRGLSLKAQQEEGTVGSPALSDMDMEDGLDAQSPRRDSTKLSSGQESDSPEKVSALNQSACPDVLANEVRQPVDLTENLNRGKQAQCRLTGDYTGSLIDNYMSDISGDSEDLEPAGDLEMAESIEATAEESKKGSNLPKQECVEPRTALVNVSFSEATEHLSASEADEQKVMELQGSEDPITCPVSVSSSEAIVHLSSSEVDEQRVVEPQKREDRGEDYRVVHNVNGSQNLRKRSPSETISKSPSKSQNESPVKTRSRSRSASPSNKAKSKSPSPSSSALQDTPGRSRPKAFSGKDANQGVFELTTRPKTGATRGANICVNYARGRCFRGDSCRLQHQVSGKVLQEEERVLEQEQNGPSKPTDPTPNAEKDEAQKTHENVEVVAMRKAKRTDPSPDGKKDEAQKTRENVEVVATRKAKRKAVSGKAEDSPQGKVAKRRESIREAAIIPGVASQEDVAIKQDMSESKNAGQPTSALEGRAAVDAATKGDLLHVKASQASEVGAWFPLPPSETGSQVTGNYGSSQFHNQDSLQSSGFPEVRPSVLAPTNNTYAVSNNEAKNYPVVPTQFSSAGPADKPGFQHPPYGNPGMIHPAAASRNPTQEYTNLAQNFTPSYSKEYGLPSKTQSGTSQNMLVPPPPVYPPIVQQRDFSVDASRGYSSLQHGITSPFSLQAQPQKSLNPSYSGGPSRQSSFSDIASREPLSMYPKSSFTFSSQSPGYRTWVNSGSSGFPSSTVPDVSPVLGQSSSYSYSLTTIPPLPSIIELPGASKPSNPSDQYDPLSDSLEPSSMAGSKSSSFNLLKTVEDVKPLGAFGKTLASQLENVSPAFDAMKGDLAEVAGDPVVGVVENVSPPEEKRLWSPGPMVEVADAKQDQLSSKNKKNNARGLKLLRSAVADQVKDVLKPTWKEGRMSKDAFKNIVKKAVDKVTAAIPSHHIPKSQEKVDQFMSSSQIKIAKLVQGYIDKYQKT